MWVGSGGVEGTATSYKRLKRMADMLSEGGRERRWRRRKKGVEEEEEERYPINSSRSQVDKVSQE